MTSPWSRQRQRQRQRRCWTAAAPVLTTVLVAGAAMTGGASASSPGQSAGAPASAGPPRIAGCPVFPADNPWNQRVDRLPVARNSAKIIARIGLNDPVHPDFGTVWDGAPNGIPYAVVSEHTRRVFVRFRYAAESDGHDYPLPRNVPIEGGPRATGDRHVIVLDRSTCTD
ncbi:MAG TPA: hypothetical protein VFN87_20220, partial [Solirubrobacteraceae bacterium]|nr:hypothetical protein [Solirubrobacteraceae bacterium]